MPKSKHSEAAIIAALQQMNAGRTTAEVGREVGVSSELVPDILVCDFRGQVSGIRVVDKKEHLLPKSASLNDLHSRPDENIASFKELSRHE